MIEQKQCPKCGFFIFNQDHSCENPIYGLDPDRVLSALLKVPPLKKEKKKKEKKIIARTGKETEIKRLLGELKIKEIEEWVKETIISLDNLIFALFPKALNTYTNWIKFTYYAWEFDEANFGFIPQKTKKLKLGKKVNIST
jgi:hypothetical protein